MYADFYNDNFENEEQKADEYLKSGEYSLAYENYTLVESDHALLMMAKLLFYGLGVPQDDKESLKYFEQYLFNNDQSINRWKAIPYITVLLYERLLLTRSTRYLERLEIIANYENYFLALYFLFQYYSDEEDRFYTFSRRTNTSADPVLADTYKQKYICSVNSGEYERFQEKFFDSENNVYVLPCEDSLEYENILYLHKSRPSINFKDEVDVFYLNASYKSTQNTNVLESFRVLARIFAGQYYTIKCKDGLRAEILFKTAMDTAFFSKNIIAYTLALYNDFLFRFPESLMNNKLNFETRFRQVENYFNDSQALREENAYLICKIKIVIGCLIYNGTDENRENESEKYLVSACNNIGKWNAAIVAQIGGLFYQYQQDVSFDGIKIPIECRLNERVGYKLIYEARRYGSAQALTYLENIARNYYIFREDNSNNGISSAFLTIPSPQKYIDRNLSTGVNSLTVCEKIYKYSYGNMEGWCENQYDGFLDDNPKANMYYKGYGYIDEMISNMYYSMYYSQRKRNANEYLNQDLAENKYREFFYNLTDTEIELIRKVIDYERSRIVIDDTEVDQYYIDAINSKSRQIFGRYILDGSADKGIIKIAKYFTKTIDILTWMLQI